MTAVEGYAVIESSVVAPLRVPASGRQRQFDAGPNSVNEAEIQLPPAAWHNRLQVPNSEIAACQLSMNTGFRETLRLGLRPPVALAGMGRIGHVLCADWFGYTTFSSSPRVFHFCLVGRAIERRPCGRVLAQGGAASLAVGQRLRPPAAARLDLSCAPE